MPTVDELLIEEREKFIIMDSFFRQCAKHIRGLPSSPSEEDIERHLATCREYYELYGTRDGQYSPWFTAGGYV